MKNITLLLLLACTVAISQDHLKQEKPNKAVHLREIPRHNLLMDLGITQPTGDYKDVAKAGLHIGLDYTYYINKNLGLSSGIKLQTNQFGYLDSDTNPENEITNQAYRTISVAIGPTYSHTINRFQFDAFFKAGVAFYNNPSNRVTNFELQDAPDRILYQSDSANSSPSSAYIEGGLRFNYYFRRSVQVFFSPQWNTTLGNPIGYNFLDIEGTSFNPEEVRTINASNLVFSLGVKIALSPEYSSGENRYDGED